MVSHRSLVSWLLVIGLVGIYAQVYEDPSANSSQLNERSLSSNVANEDEDSQAIEDMIVQLDKVRIYKRSIPKSSKGKMSTEDYEWHIREGEKTMEKISEESATAKRTYPSKQQQSKDMESGRRGQKQRGSKTEWLGGKEGAKELPLVVPNPNYVQGIKFYHRRRRLYICL